MTCAAGALGNCRLGSTNHMLLAAYCRWQQHIAIATCASGMLHLLHKHTNMQATVKLHEAAATANVAHTLHQRRQAAGICSHLHTRPPPDEHAPASLQPWHRLLVGRAQLDGRHPADATAWRAGWLLVRRRALIVGDGVAVIITLGRGPPPAHRTQTV